MHNCVCSSEQGSMKVQYHMRPWSGFPAHSLLRVFYCILWLGLNCCTMFVISGFNLSTFAFLNFLSLCSAHCSTFYQMCNICHPSFLRCIHVFYCILWLCSSCTLYVHCSLKVHAMLHCYIVEPLLLRLLNIVL